MSTFTVRLPDDKHERLKVLAAYKKVSVKKSIAEFDSETRFRVLASQGETKKGLEILEK